MAKISQARINRIQKKRIDLIVRKIDSPNEWTPEDACRLDIETERLRKVMRPLYDEQIRAINRAKKKLDRDTKKVKAIMERLRGKHF